MSKSTDETNELESYGVWVKHPAEANEESAIQDIDLASSDDLDLPDFDDTDFSDMFKDDTEFSTAETENFIDDDNTTLTIDELANITSTAETTEEDIQEDNADDDLAVDDSVFEEADSTESELEIDDSVFEEASAEDELSIDDSIFEESGAADSDNALSLEETNTVDELDLSAFETEETTTDELVENTDEELNLDDFNFESETEATEETAEETPVEEELSIDDFDFDSETEITEETTTEAPVEEEISLDDFGIEETTEEEVTVSDSGEEEISLDDFMDEGFSDESVASGNNGFAADAIPTPAPQTSSDSEEISLDDFGFSDIEEAAPQAAEVIEEEPPLEMDITFDDSVDSLETEENVSVDSDSYDYDDDDTEEEEEIATEEVSLDDFASDTSEIETESVDLSDFGIDSDAEETPIEQDVTAEKLKEQKVDYDLSVGNTTANAAPVVTEIEDTTEEIKEVEDIVTETPASTQPATPTADNNAAISNALLQQIVNDLSGLKNEINQLKTNLANLEEKNTSGFVAEAPVTEDIPATEPEENNGFFGSDDGDDTIALSFDELDNIMNNAEFNSEENVEPSAEETIEENVISEEELAEPVIEETAVDISESEDLPESFDFESTNEIIEENNFTSSDDTVAFEADDLPEEISIPKYEDNEVTEDSIFVESETTEEPVIEEDTVDSMFVEAETSEEPVTEDTADSLFVEAETTEEPVIEETTDSMFDEAEVSEEPLVEEETLDDSIFVEAETTEEPVIEDAADSMFVEAEPSEEITVEDVMEVSEEIEEVAEENDFLNLDDLSSETIEEEPVIEETTEELVTESNDDTLVMDDVIEESTISEDDTIVEESGFIANDNEPLIEDVFTDEDIAANATDDSDLNFDSIVEESEPVIEETAIEESEITETVEEEDIPVEEPVIEETTEPTVNASLAEPDPFDLTQDEGLTESNINYLTKENDAAEGNSSNEELKQDIKSVLLYMDQLLENLPEEKIIEFAKSDEFTTYKKLFSELGLS